MGNRLFGIAMTIGVAIFMMAFPLDQACAQKKVALVIGNSNYTSVPKLPNPARDAISVGQMLRDANFEVVDVVVNATNIELKRAIRKFEYEADQSEVAIVFYSGHGIEIAGNNYLIPVDAKLATDRDADDETVTLERLASSADGASKLKLIILDACRENPFPAQMRTNRKNNNRQIASGLGKVEPTSGDTLIAYAAKAGSTAEDGDRQHSPFTNAILKNLTVPGLDIRLAFGRIRDEVMRATGSRQEPFVYGSLGGGNISIVPAPKELDPQSADAKAEYEIVSKIGTLRAWEVFLSKYKTGFYADLARVQVAGLSEQQADGATSVARSPGNSNMQLAGNQPAPAPGGRDSSSKEVLDWDRIKDSSDPAAFEQFIAKYPDAPLALSAQRRLEVLRQAVREREEARAAAERARIEEERKKAEAAAAIKREDDARRAREAEIAEKARIAAAEAAAAKKRDEEERRAKAAEAEQRARAAEAERKAVEARQKAEQAERDRQAAAEAAARAAAEKQARQQEAEQRARMSEAERKANDEKRKAEQEAAAARAAAEQQAREAEEQRKKVQQAAAIEAACKAEQSKFDELGAKGSNGDGAANMASFAKSVTCDRLRPQVTATLNRFNSEATCRTEQAKFDALNAKGSEDAGAPNMASFAKTVTCDALRPLVAGAVERFMAEAAKRPNSPALVLAAQTELVRLGCTIPGKPDGVLNPPTKAALARFMTIKSRPADNITVTDALVAELSKQTDRVCPLVCKSNEVLQGDKCIVQKPAATSRRKDDDEDAAPARRKPQPEKRQAEKPRPAPEPRVREQAGSRPAGGGGGGGSSGGAISAHGLSF